MFIVMRANSMTSSGRATCFGEWTDRSGSDAVWMWHAHLARDSRAGRPCHSVKLHRYRSIAQRFGSFGACEISCQRGAINISSPGLR
jgi:hypothetical protein